MKTVYTVLIMCLIFAITVAAGLQFSVPWRLTDDWIATFALVPLACMIMAMLRAPQAAVPSWLAFGCGIVMDILSHGVLGYWALTYTTCTLLARFIPNWFNIWLITRLCSHVAIGLSVFILHILLHIALNWNGILGELAWIGIAHSTLRMSLFAATVEVIFAIFAKLSFQFEGFGSLALPKNRERYDSN